MAGRDAGDVRRAVREGRGRGDHGARHLRAQLEPVHAWPTFVQLLEEQAFSPEEEVLCEQAALETFEVFNTAFARAEAFAKAS